MTKKMKPIVFDAHAILKWLQMEQGWEEVKKVLVACSEKKIDGYMNQINLGEVYYKTIRVVGLEQGRRFLRDFSLLPIQVLVPDSDLIWKAAEIKAEYSISYADCFAAATAFKLSASILTGDPDFKKLKDIVDIQWI